MRGARTILTSILLPLLCGCGGGNGTGELATTVGAFTTPYLIVDLATGNLTTAVAIDDLATGADYKGSRMVFRRVDASNGLPTYFIAVFEMTQAQWRAMGGTALWNEPEARLAGGGVDDDDLPACGLDRTTCVNLLTAFNAGRPVRLQLPSDAQWEYACRAGNSGDFSWSVTPGFDLDVAVEVKPYAVVAETQDGKEGPQQVDATRQPNAFGLWDMHGNLWEWTSDGTDHLRGGSWNDTVFVARSANLGSLDQDTRHPLVGVRLVLVP